MHPADDVAAQFLRMTDEAYDVAVDDYLDILFCGLLGHNYVLFLFLAESEHADHASMQRCAGALLVQVACGVERMMQQRSQRLGLKFEPSTSSHTVAT